MISFFRTSTKSSCVKRQVSKHFHSRNINQNQKRIQEEGGGARGAQLNGLFSGFLIPRGCSAPLKKKNKPPPMDKFLNTPLIKILLILFRKLFSRIQLYFVSLMKFFPNVFSRLSEPVPPGEPGDELPLPENNQV